MPWARPRRERTLLGLVAFSALSSVHARGTQDVTRLCLTHALLHGHLTIEPCAGRTMDHAFYNGREYSDKAPGYSFLAVPIVWLIGMFGTQPAHEWGQADLRLWLVRVATTGVAFVVLAFLVGRVSEGIAPRFGGAALVAFSLGTYVYPLAATTLDHVLAGTFAFGAFLLAWSRRYAAAGLLAALATDTNYLCALIACAIAAYVLAAGARPLVRFAAGAAGPLVFLGAYDWAAFGSPFHLSYRYVANKYATDQAAGLFGIGAPHAYSSQQVLLAERGILIAAPVLVAAVAGTVLLARRYRHEAILAAVVFAALVLVNCGYFLPYGGTAVGPRFLVPALPFIALGLAPAFARWFRPTALVAAVSIVSMTALAHFGGGQTIWGALSRLLPRAYHAYHDARTPPLLARNVLEAVGLGRVEAVLLVCLAVAAAYVVALREPRERARVA